MLSFAQAGQITHPPHRCRHRQAGTHIHRQVFKSHSKRQVPSYSFSGSSPLRPYLSAPPSSPSPTDGNGRYSQDNKDNKPSTVRGALSPVGAGLRVLETQLPGTDYRGSLVSVKVTSCPDGDRRAGPGRSMLVASLPAAVRPAADLNQPALPSESGPSTLSQERNCRLFLS